MGMARVHGNGVDISGEEGSVQDAESGNDRNGKTFHTWNSLSILRGLEQP